MPKNVYDFKQMKEGLKNLTGKKKDYSDDRFYKLKFDENNKANAVIRFLPPKSGSGLPIVKKLDHFVRLSNGWFVEDCPRTLEKKCPVCEWLYKQGKDEYERLKNIYARTHFYANILVLNDPLTPTNNGKVFLFQFGKGIMNMISDKISPESAIDEECDIFDYAEGMDFKLKATYRDSNGSRFPDYRESQFSEKRPVTINGQRAPESFLETLDEKMYDLSEFTDPARFKSYDEIWTKFVEKMNLLVPDSEVSTAPAAAPAPAPEATRRPAAEDIPQQPKSNVNEFANGQDTLGEDFFANL